MVGGTWNQDRHRERYVSHCCRISLHSAFSLKARMGSSISTSRVHTDNLYFHVVYTGDPRIYHVLRPHMMTKEVSLEHDWRYLVAWRAHALPLHLLMAFFRRTSRVLGLLGDTLGGLHPAHSHRQNKKNKPSLAPYGTSTTYLYSVSPMTQVGDALFPRDAACHAPKLLQGADTYPRPVGHGQHLQHSIRLCHGRKIGTPQIQDGSQPSLAGLFPFTVFTTSASRSLQTSDSL